MVHESPREYLEWIKGQKDLKTVRTDTNDFALIDVAMRAFGGDTKVYLENVILQEKMRRGLTFIEKESKLEIARQGLPKFFDFELDFLNSESKSCKVKPSDYPITVYNLEKLNGENAQISWSPMVNKWIVCSKNVGFSAASVEEATELYSAIPRFNYALHIARHWFNNTLPKLQHVD